MIEQAKTERFGRLLAVSVLTLLSLLVAFVLFYFFESSALVKNKFISLGGAIAGFVAVFLLLRNTYFREGSNEATLQRVSAEEKIRILQKQIDNLLASELENFVVPEGYSREVSTEFGFGFCYPENWKFRMFPQAVHYGGAFDLEFAEKHGFGRNFNIIVTDLGDHVGSLEKLYEATAAFELYATPNAKIVSKESFLFQGRPAFRYQMNWVDKIGNHLVCYQILLADEEGGKLYKITFTTLQEDFTSSRTLFDDIAGTFRMKQRQLSGVK